MKKLAFAITLALFVALAPNIDAAPLTVDDFRGTVQTVTTTGTQTLSLGSTTTIVRFNLASPADIVAITGGTDGRIIWFQNAGSSTATLYHEYTSGTTASQRILLDGNGAGRTLFGDGIGQGMAIYDGTTQRWRFAPFEGFLTGGSKTIAGDLSVWSSAIVSGNLTVNTDAVIAGTLDTGNTTIAGTGSPRLALQSTNGSNDGSSVRFLDSSGASLFTFGTDYAGNGSVNDFWLYDNASTVTNLWVKNTGVSWLLFGTSGNQGGFSHDNSTGETTFFGGSDDKIQLHDYWSLVYDHLHFARGAGTSQPTLGSNCNGSTTATKSAETNDHVGAITLGTGATACTVTFGTPWDVGVNQGQPICTANTSTSGRTVAITAIGDHDVTFTPSAAGATTIYYTCLGGLPSGF